MLILTRNIGQYVVIGDGLIYVKVCGIHGYQVQLGFDAPHEIAVHREEIYWRVQEEEKRKREKEQHDLLLPGM